MNQSYNIQKLSIDKHSNIEYYKCGMYDTIVKKKGVISMKRYIAILLSILLLSACGAEEQAPASGPESNPSPVSESAPEPEPDPEPGPLPDLQPGRILADIDDQLIPAEEIKGTQAELDRWKEAVRDPAVAWLEYTDLGEEERELPVETEEEFLTMLRQAQLRLYGPEEQLPNPHTGGGWTILAYDGEGELLFYTHSMGNRFNVRLAGEETAWIFDGEDIIPSTLHPPEAAPIPLEQLPDEGSGDPDPGTGIPDPGPDMATRSQVEALVAYLEENLDLWDYSNIQAYIGGGRDEAYIEVLTPTPDPVRRVVEAFSGAAVPVECPYVPFSKGQMDQARKDAERFLEEHPEIELLGIRAQLGLFSGWIINVREENSALTEFVKNYSIADIYQVVTGVTEFPD